MSKVGIIRVYAKQARDLFNLQKEVIASIEYLKSLTPLTERLKLYLRVNIELRNELKKAVPYISVINELLNELKKFEDPKYEFTKSGYENHIISSFSKN